MQRSLLGTTVKWPEDKNMGAIFYKSLESLFTGKRINSSVKEEFKSDFEKVFNRFQNALDGNKSRARETWENCCWIHFEGKTIDPFDENLGVLVSYDKVRHLMNVANEAYHIAYSCALKRSIDQQPEPIATRPLTSYCPAYNHLLKIESNDEIEPYNLQMLGNYLITVKYLNFKDSANYNWIQDLQFNSELREIRKEYVEGINRFIYGRCRQSEISALSKLYRKELSNIIYPHTNFKIVPRVFVELGLGLVTTSLVGFGGGAAISYFMNRYGGKVFGSLIDAPNVNNELQREGIDAVFFKESERMARDLGLINAKLDTEASDSYLEDIPSFNPNL